MTDSTIRARFAPSPTGYLHVGGARTALFNWLFCRRFGGTFIIRIEDTDIQRNIEGAEEKLLEDLRWLGIDWDEGPDVGGAFGPYRQSERRALYDQARDRLLGAGLAYYAFDTAEELDAMRRRAAAEKRSFRYPRPAAFPSAADAERVRAEGRPVVVRFKVPDEPITIRDDVLGEVSFASGEVEDLVIVKSNGWPTYHFAVVVDDYHMKITHVLRAQEHLMNTPKHVFMQRALGYPTPTFAHLPLVFNIDGSKMSKRDKHKAVRAAVKERIRRNEWDLQALSRSAACDEPAAGRWLNDQADAEFDMDRLARVAAAAGAMVPEIDVHDFRVAGYLPEALRSFVALIGWSPGDNREKLTLDEMVEAFSLDRINKTAGRFDREKLLAMNTDWAATLPAERLAAGFRDWAAASGSAMAGLDDAALAKVLESCRGFRTFADVEYKAGVLFADDAAVRYGPSADMDERTMKDARAGQKVLTKNSGAGIAVLRRLLPELEAVEPWSEETLDGWIASYCEANGLKLGDVAQPLRVAVAGRPVSPAIGLTLALLGKRMTLDRIRRCVEWAATATT